MADSASHKVCTFVLGGGVYEVYRDTPLTSDEWRAFGRSLYDTLQGRWDGDVSLIFPPEFRVVRTDKPADEPPPLPMTYDTASDPIAAMEWQLTKDAAPVPIPHFDANSVEGMRTEVSGAAFGLPQEMDYLPPDDATPLIVE